MSLQQEIEAATRRGQRITALRAGKPIPFPETAEADARAGNTDDAIIIAMIRGQAKVPGAKTFPPARQLAKSQAAVTSEATLMFANEIIEAIGPMMLGKCAGGYYMPA